MMQNIIDIDMTIFIPIYRQFFWSLINKADSNLVVWCNMCNVHFVFCLT